MVSPKKKNKEITQKERINKNPEYENNVSFGKHHIKDKLSKSSLATDKPTATISKIPNKGGRKVSKQDERSTQKGIDGYSPMNYSFAAKRSQVESSSVEKHNISAEYASQPSSTKHQREYISNLIESSKHYSKIDSARADHSPLPESKERYSYLKAYRYSTPQKIELPRIVASLKDRSPDPRTRNKSEDNSFHLKRLEFYRDKREKSGDMGKNSSITTKDASHMNSGTNVSSIVEREVEVKTSRNRFKYSFYCL
jgi:hypothetical protein